jgi:mono/diheme cytochrome c family protein
MTKRALHIAAIAVVAFTAMGCHLDMWDRSRLKPYEAYGFFDNGSSTRPLPEGTVPFGGAKIDEHFYKGTINGQFAATYPMEITEEVLARGKDRYMVFCTPCHGYTGDGRGMIVQREMKEAASHTGDPRLLDPEQAPPGYFFDVITNGFGVMYPQATRIKPEDRWAIAAYIKALQISQNMSYAELSDRQKDEFEKQLAGGTDDHAGGHSTEEAH